MKKLTIIILFTTINFSLLTFNSYSQWYQVNLPVSSQVTRVQFVNQNTGWIMLYNRYLLKSTNSGVNWFVVSDSTRHLFDIQFINDTLGYGLGKYGLDNLMLRSTDGGYNWAVLQSTQQYMLSGFYFINSDTGYINGFNMSYYTFRTTNGLQAIELISSGAGGSPASIWFSKYPYNNQLCGYISGGGNLWKTTNSGYNWSQLSFGETGNVNSFSFINKDTGFVVYNPSIGNNTKIFYTSNSGQNWSLSYYYNINNGLGLICAVNNYKTWCGGDNLIKTVNGGINWGRQLSPLLYPSRVYMVDTSFGFSWNIYSINNLARTTNGGGPILPVNKISEEVPVNYELSQNYPNPFNPSTTIEFNLPKQSTVSLQIFDILGRKVSDVISSAKYGPGAYKVSIDFNSKNLSGGIYLCKFTAYQKNSGNVISLTRKMIYNK